VGSSWGGAGGGGDKRGSVSGSMEGLGILSITEDNNRDELLHSGRLPDKL